MKQEREVAVDGIAGRGNRLEKNADNLFLIRIQLRNPSRKHFLARAILHACTDLLDSYKSRPHKRAQGGIGRTSESEQLRNGNRRFRGEQGFKDRALLGSLLAENSKFQGVRSFEKPRHPDLFSGDFFAP